MREKDKYRFKEIFEKQAAFLQRSIRADDLRKYWKALQDQSLEDIENALDELVKEKAFLPLPPLIRDKIRDIKIATTPYLARKCEKCGKADVVPGENLCCKCYGVTKPGPEYFKNIYSLLDGKSKEQCL